MYNNHKIITESVHRLKKKGVLFENALSDAEISSIQDRFGFVFPPELRMFLQIAVPISDYFPQWRSDTGQQLRDWLDRPIEGILFDVRNNVFWHEKWGQRPTDVREAIAIARDHLSRVPKLIPIGDRVYLKCIPETPAEPGNPVFSVNQTDVLHAGRNFCDFLWWFSRPKSEFDGDEESGIAPTPTHGDDYREIPFWSELVRRNC